MQFPTRRSIVTVKTIPVIVELKLLYLHRLCIDIQTNSIQRLIVTISPSATSLQTLFMTVHRKMGRETSIRYSERQLLLLYITIIIVSELLQQRIKDQPRTTASTKASYHWRNRTWRDRRFKRPLVGLQKRRAWKDRRKKSSKSLERSKRQEERMLARNQSSTEKYFKNQYLARSFAIMVRTTL